MLDYFNNIKPQMGSIEYYPGLSSSAGNTWQVWNKPRGISMIQITCIGGGGGGRTGWKSLTGSGATRSGGGGGGSGGVSFVTIPEFILPDILYVSAGAGGAGGVNSSSSGASAGSGGIGSYVSITRSTAAIYTICFANGGSGAVVGTESAGTGGLAASVATAAATLLSAQGYLFAFAGQAGSSGNITTGTSITYPTTGLLLSGGACGGGGIAAAGQNITAPASQTSVYNIFQTIIGGSNDLSGLDGSSGIELYQPLLSTGGSGGGSSTSAIDSGGSGGNGGAGGFGSGGGGGGAGPTSTTISSTNLGGKGGSGLVIINCW